MWLSEQREKRIQASPAAELGTVTLAGDPAGVYLAGERRNLPVAGPGGYFWRPVQGEQVMVIKAGGEGETPCVAGRIQMGELRPGEIRITAGEASVALLPEGRVDIRGEIYINGEKISGLLSAEGAGE